MRTLACLLPLLAACQAQSVARMPETPAILAQPSDVARMELHSTVARMLKAPSVALADDALLRESLMIIQKNRPRNGQGVQLSGRDFDKPEQFRLLKIGPACVLEHIRTGTREVLRESRCTAADK